MRSRETAVEAWSSSGTSSDPCMPIRSPGAYPSNAQATVLAFSTTSRGPIQMQASDIDAEPVSGRARQGEVAVNISPAFPTRSLAATALLPRRGWAGGLHDIDLDIVGCDL